MKCPNCGKDLDKLICMNVECGFNLKQSDLVLLSKIDCSRLKEINLYIKYMDEQERADVKRIRNYLDNNSNHVQSEYSNSDDECPNGLGNLWKEVISSKNKLNINNMSVIDHNMSLLRDKQTLLKEKELFDNEGQILLKKNELLEMSGEIYKTVIEVLESIALLQESIGQTAQRLNDLKKENRASDYELYKDGCREIVIEYENSHLYLSAAVDELLFCGKTMMSTMMEYQSVLDNEFLKKINETNEQIEYVKKANETVGQSLFKLKGLIESTAI